MTTMFPLSSRPRTPAAKPLAACDDKDFNGRTKRTGSQSALIPKSPAFSTDALRLLEGRVADVAFKNPEGRTHSLVAYDDRRVDTNWNPLPQISSNSPPLSSSGSSSVQLTIARRITALEQEVLPKLHQRSLTLDKGTFMIGQLERLYREANQQSSIQESQRIKMLIDRLTLVVDQMNQSISVLTSRDLQMIGSFFTPPLEQFYTDPATGQIYLLADNSQLVKLATLAWAQTSCYSAIEVSKLYKVSDYSEIQPDSREGGFSNLCDVIFFEKLATAKDSWLNPRNFFFRGVDKGRTEQQRNVLSIAHTYLQRAYRSLGYRGFCTLRTEEQLLSLGLSADSAKKYQAVCLFLEPIDKAEQ